MFSLLKSNYLLVNNSLFSRTSFFRVTPVQRHRNFATNQSGDTPLELLTSGIKHYNDNASGDAYKCLARVVKDEKADERLKAVAHLYIAKTQMLVGSSKTEWFAIGNLEKSHELFTRIKTEEDYYSKKYKPEMLAEFRKISGLYGSLEKYKKELENHLKALGIFPKVSMLPTLKM